VFGRAHLPGPTRKALTIPIEAVRSQGQVRSVFVADDGIARLRLVRMRDTEVQAGLVAGESVIVAPHPALVDGRRITVGAVR
jgi:hypothetical protein